VSARRAAPQFPSVLPGSFRRNLLAALVEILKTVKSLLLNLKVPSTGISCLFDNVQTV
jgi:hypothetical protein